MKKCLTVLLVIAVMFTFSFGSAFAATEYTKDQVEDALYDRVEAYSNTLNTTVRNQLLEQYYPFNDEGFYGFNSSGTYYYFDRDAINKTISEVIKDFEEEAEAAIDKTIEDGSFPMNAIPYNVVSDIEAKYTYDLFPNLINSVKGGEGANEYLYLVDYSISELVNYIEEQFSAALASLDNYSDENAEQVVALVEKYQADYDEIVYKAPCDDYSVLLKYGQLYYGDGSSEKGFKAELDAIDTLEDEDYTGVDKEVAIASAVADFESFGLNTVYTVFHLTADQAVPAAYTAAGTLDEIYEEGIGNKVTIFGVEVADKTDVKTAEATAVNRALRAAILDASDVVTAYANTFETTTAAVSAIKDLYNDGTRSYEFMRSLNKAIKAVGVYEDVVELGEDYKAEEVDGIKKYNDENVDKAVEKAEELVYGDLGEASFKSAADYIKDAAAELDITLEEVNFELQRFTAAIKDAIEKMYSNITTWTPAKKVTYGTDKTPEEDYVYLAETYAHNTDTLKTQDKWDEIAKQAVRDLQDAESYDEIDSILAAAADDFSALTLRSEQKAVEAAKDEYEDALKAYQKVQEALLGTSDYPSGAYDDVVAEGVKLINEATTVVGVEAAYEDAKDLFGTMLKTRTEVDEMEDSLKAAIRALDTTDLTVEDKDAVMAVYDEYLAFVQTPGVDASDITGESKIEDALKEVLELEADALQDEIDAMVKSLEKVDAISDASMEAYIALKADVEALITDAKAFTDEVKAINDVKGDTEFAELTVSVNAAELEATIGATGSGFWYREARLVESALIQAARDGASVAEMQAALDAYEALTDRQQYSLDASALQLVSVINDRVVASVESIKITASSSATKGAMTIKWRVTGDTAGVDAFEIWRSTKKSSGFQKFFTTTDGTKRTYKNTKSLKAGTRYYYKVRGIAYDINGTKIYSDWSNKAYRIAK